MRGRRSAGAGVPKYLLTIRSGRAPSRPRGSCIGHRRANFVSGKAREEGDLAEPIVDRAQRRRGRKAPARPASQDRGGVSRWTAMGEAQVFRGGRVLREGKAEEVPLVVEGERISGLGA